MHWHFKAHVFQLNLCVSFSEIYVRARNGEKLLKAGHECIFALGFSVFSYRDFRLKVDIFGN